MTTTVSSEPFVFSPGAAAPSAGPASRDGTDRLVAETRREISEIVREVAVAVRSDRTTNEFFGLLVDRIQRAMAAEGVLVWEIWDSIECRRSLGRITDQSIPKQSVATHQRLLAEVASEGQPVVVPASPGADDGEVPANPTDVPVALVPIELEPSADGPSYLLEVFLESDCGVATQRGYLRFVAQMADLAGEFLRGDQLRSLRRRQQLAGLIDEAVVDLHRAANRQTLEATIVDRAADIFGFDRVGLCRLQPLKLVVVSHVESIDKKSTSAMQLGKAAESDLDSDGCLWFTDVDSLDSELIVRAVVTDRTNPKWSLVCQQVPDVEPISADHRSELLRFMQHASMALENANRRSATLTARLMGSLVPAGTESGSSRMRRLLGIGTLAIVSALLALFPIPLVVSSPAIIRPEQVQTITAPRDAVVDRIHVSHGQAVADGDLLMTLVDPDLEAQMTALIGRRAVLVQQQSHWTDALVDTASREFDRLEKVQGESRLVSEEIQSIDNQLAVLRRAEATLSIHANRDGIVDAWQIEQRLQSRPLQRGDWLLQVIDANSDWTVEAKVPQTRVGHVSHAIAAADIDVNVSLDANPSETFVATVKRLGPAIDTGTGVPKSTAVLMRLDDNATAAISSMQQTSHQSGAPARVMFHCGTAPAGFVLFQDLIRTVRGTTALYLGGQGDSGT